MSVTTPDDRRYANEDLWAKAVDDGVRVGITDFAQDQLGDIVYVDCPDVGRTVTAGQDMGEVESTKTISDLIAPISGQVVAINEALNEHPELLNESPYEKGWIALIEPASAGELDALMTAAAYDASRT